MLCQELPLDAERLGIFGHSMGGHGALTLALRHPGVFKSLSAFRADQQPGRLSVGHQGFRRLSGRRQYQLAGT